MKLKYYFMKTTKAEKELVQDCNIIYQACCENDNLQNALFFEDKYNLLPDYPRLYYAIFEKKLIGFLSAFVFGEDNIEICIFVHPDFRNQKIGTTLLAQFLNDYDGKYIEVTVHPDNQIGISFLERNHFCYSSTELSMCAALKTDIPNVADIQNSKKRLPASASDINIIHKKRDASSSTLQCIVNNICIGTCTISPLSDATICISHVEILDSYRNQGFGYQFMAKVLQELSLSFDNALLHVTKENTPAYRLYRKLGFKEIDTALIYTNN